MDIFDQLDIVEKRILSTPKKNNVNSLLSPANCEEPPVNLNLMASPTGSIATNKEKNDIELFQTEIFPVETKDLVWAPFYRFHNALFPARLCSMEEALGERSIPARIEQDCVVVEFFKQVKHQDSSRLLLVKKAKIVPYYKKTNKDTSDDLTRWNEGNFKTVKQALDKKYKKSLALTILNEIVETSTEFLRLGLKKDEEIKSLLHREDDSAVEAKPDLSSPIKSDNLASNVTPGKSGKNSHLKDLLFLRSNEPIPLKKGDRIAYRNKFTGNECESIVEEFLDRHQISLQNGDVLGKTDLICKLLLRSSLKDEEAATLKSSSNSSYVKHSSGYQEVNIFVFDEVGTTRSKRKFSLSQEQQNAVETGEPQISAKEAKRKRK